MRFRMIILKTMCSMCLIWRNFQAYLVGRNFSTYAKASVDEERRPTSYYDTPSVHHHPLPVFQQVPLLQ